MLKTNCLAVEDSISGKGFEFQLNILLGQAWYGHTHHDFICFSWERGDPCAVFCMVRLQSHQVVPVEGQHDKIVPYIVIWIIYQLPSSLQAVITMYVGGEFIAFRVTSWARCPRKLNPVLSKDVPGAGKQYARAGLLPFDAKRTLCNIVLVFIDNDVNHPVQFLIEVGHVPDDKFWNSLQFQSPPCIFPILSLKSWSPRIQRTLFCLFQLLLCVKIQNHCVFVCCLPNSLVSVAENWLISPFVGHGKVDPSLRTADTCVGFPVHCNLMVLN